MRNKIILFAIISLAFPSLSSAKKANEKVPTLTAQTMSAQDSVSYAIGIEFARSVQQNLSSLPGGPFNADILLEGFSKMFKNDTTALKIKCSESEAFVSTALRHAQELQIEKNKAAGKQFLEENKKRLGVTTTQSGLQYEVLKKGNSVISPTATDRVKVHYHGTLIDGTVFDSSVERGEPVEFELNKVIPGWTEGLQLMTIGSKYRFFIPCELGYGSRANGKIQSYSTLIFDVDLIDVGKPTSQPQQQPSANNGSKFQFPSYQRAGL